MNLIDERGILHSTTIDDETIEYYLNGNVTKTITKESDSIIISNVLDDKKRIHIINETTSSTLSTQINYDSKDNIREIIQPNNNHIKFEYDYKGRIIKEETKKSNNEKISVQYDYLKTEDSSTSLVKEAQYKVNNVLSDVLRYNNNMILEMRELCLEK